MIRVLAIGWALGWWSVQPAAAQDCDRPNKAVCEDLKRQQVVSSEDALKGGAGVQGVSAEVEKRASREYGELSAGTREKLHRLVSACFEAARGRNHTEYCAAREAYYGPASPADTQGVVEIGNAGGGENNAGVMGKLPDSDWLPGRYRFTVRSAAAPATNGKAAWDSLGGGST